MRLCLLASGSKGNCFYLESDSCRLLIDAGLSAREAQNRLSSIGVAAETLDGILITHEHNDHVRGVGALARRLKIPVLVSSRTHRAAHSVLGKVNPIEFDPGCAFTFKGLSIDPFPI